MSPGAAHLLLLTYGVVLGLLGLNGAHRLSLLLQLRGARRAPAGNVTDRPVVTVQIPLFNEPHVAARVIRAVAALEWPRDRLEIQVLDDSTDETSAIASLVVAELAADGLDIRHLRRDARTGFKAGALAAGLAVARGGLVAVFDADFVPERDFLARVVRAMAPDVGMVQARWGHLNASAGWLTRVQSVFLDGHFAVEHEARFRSGHWFNFNGTAGVWRREAIESAGGWQHDTLTEDLDLSYRAQLAGWRFVYLDDVVAPAELPTSIMAFKAQQNRWARGAIQTARKLLGRVAWADAPAATRAEAVAHLLANLAYPLVVGLTILMPWMTVARDAATSLPPLSVDLVLLTLAIVPFVLYYAVAIHRVDGCGARWRMLPFALAVGIGMSVVQTRAVFQGVFGPVGVFVRTPKEGSAGRGATSAGRSLAPLFELGLAAYLGAGMIWALSAGRWLAVPFQLLFFCGYALVGVRTLVEALQARVPSTGTQVSHQSHTGSVHAPETGSSPESTA